MIYLTPVPSIVVEESESAGLAVPRPAFPSIDLTQMRNTMGTGYMSHQSDVGQAGGLQSPSSQQSDRDPGVNSPARTWSSIGGPESQIARSHSTSRL